jgi:archaemetzincin
VSLIYLLPLGSADRTLVSALRSPLMETFRAEVAIDEMNLDLEQFYDRERVQYNSTEMLSHLLRVHSTVSRRSFSTPSSSSKRLAIVSEDLFVPILTFVFGEAELSGNVAVVSYHRLQNELYGLPRNSELLFQRLLKEAVHELGHSYGLVHCTTQECVMHTSTYVEDIDRKGSTFCKQCSPLMEKPS